MLWNVKSNHKGPQKAIIIKSIVTTYSWGGSATRTTTFSSRGNTTNWSSQHWALTTYYSKRTFSPNTSKTRGKKGTISTFNWSIFNTPTIVPTTEVKCIIGWVKHRTYLTCLWGNLYRTEMAVYNTQLLHFQSHYAFSINTSCWLLYIGIGSYFESNHSRFRIRRQPTFNPIRTSM